LRPWRSKEKEKVDAKILIVSNLHANKITKTCFNDGNCSPGSPDRANFRLFGDGLLWAVVLKITEVAQFLRGNFFSRGFSYVLIVTKNVWAIFWATFSQKHQVTLLLTCRDGRTGRPRGSSS
jgi:hypothetical protein